MNSVKITVVYAFKRPASFGLGDRGKRAKGHREFTTINPLAVPTDIKNVLVVSELATSHNAMNLLRRPMNFCVGGIGSVTRPDRRKRRVRMVKKPKDFA